MSTSTVLPVGGIAQPAAISVGVPMVITIALVALIGWGSRRWAHRNAYLKDGGRAAGVRVVRVVRSRPRSLALPLHSPRFGVQMKASGDVSWAWVLQSPVDCTARRRGDAPPR